MDRLARIEKTLEDAVARGAVDGSPPILSEAIRHALFSGGARVRPQLSLAVAEACGDPDPRASAGTAAAIEMLHCASLVHDDLPCFDDADERRGRISVHKAFGEPVAVLAGDALIVMAFETVARGGIASPQRIGGMITSLARAVGLPHGIVAGQGWESEPDAGVARYHAQKTGALFVGATVGGAIAAGSDPGPWRPLGEKLGAAYQVADDLADAMGGVDDLGKPCGQDEKNGRPTIVAELGLGGAVRKLEQMVRAAADAVPDCDGADELRALVMMQAKRLAPRQANATISAA